MHNAAPLMVPDRPVDQLLNHFQHHPVADIQPLGFHQCASYSNCCQGAAGPSQHAQNSPGKFTSPEPLVPLTNDLGSDRLGLNRRGK